MGNLPDNRAGELKEYRVTWSIDIGECSSPREAAEKALEVQRTSGSQATVFEVQEWAGTASRGLLVEIDLLE